jgi:hypothetical protein
MVELGSHRKEAVENPDLDAEGIQMLAPHQLEAGTRTPALRPGSAREANGLFLG